MNKQTEKAKYLLFLYNLSSVEDRSRLINNIFSQTENDVRNFFKTSLHSEFKGQKKIWRRLHTTRYCYWKVQVYWKEKGLIWEIIALTCKTSCLTILLKDFHKSALGKNNNYESFNDQVIPRFHWFCINLQPITISSFVIKNWGKSYKLCLRLIYRKKIHKFRFITKMKQERHFSCWHQRHDELRMIVITIRTPTINPWIKKFNPL